jgi:hypothetical protein
MVASIPQRKKNARRIQSSQHISHVLPAAPHDQPGVSIVSDDIIMEENVEPLAVQVSEIEQPLLQVSEFQYQALQEQLDVIQPAQTIGSTLSMHLGRPSPMTTPLSATAVSSTLAPYSVYIDSNPEPIASTSTSEFYDWRPGTKRKRRCGVCKEAGRSGYDCPGENNRAKCIYVSISMIILSDTWLNGPVRSDSHT